MEKTKIMGKIISKKTAQSHARTFRQPINLEKNSTDTDLTVFSQNEYIDKKVDEITGVQCPNYESLVVEGFKYPSDKHNQYVSKMQKLFNSNHKLIQKFKGKSFNLANWNLSEDVHGELTIKHTTQQKVRFSFENKLGEKNNIHNLVFNNIYGGLTYVVFDFKNKEIYLDVEDIDIEETINDKDLELLKNIIKEPGKESYDLNNIDAYLDSQVSARNPKIQRIFRRELLEEFECKCAICDVNIEALLVASHIIPYSKCEEVKQMIDSKNGLLLCSLHDALFDKGYISFDEYGKIEFAHNDFLPKEMYSTLNINENFRLSERALKGRKLYLKKHNVLGK